MQAFQVRHGSGLAGAIHTDEDIVDAHEPEADEIDDE